MSKPYGLPGLRIDWIACRDRELLARMEIRTCESAGRSASDASLVVWSSAMKEPVALVAGGEGGIGREAALLLAAGRAHERLAWEQDPAVWRETMLGDLPARPRAGAARG